MRRSTSAVVAVVAAWAGDAGAGRSAATEPPPPEVARLLGVSETVLNHQIDPPARQQLVLSGIRAAYRAAGLREPAGLARRVSGAATREQFAALLAEVWPRPGPEGGADAGAKNLGRAAVEGALAAVDGGPELIRAKDRKVQEQFEGNLYVGLQIALSAGEAGQAPVIQEAIKGGPADKAGVKAGDAIETVDGLPTAGAPLAEVVDRLRGEEGTAVEVGIRPKDETEVRKLRVVRGRLPRVTVEGYAKSSSDDWDFGARGDRRVAFLRVVEVTGSTPREVRVLAERLQSQGYRGLILDLRTTRTASLHATTILADDLLDAGTIGRLRTTDRVETFEADADAVFAGWPMVVLVGESTAPEAAWLAAALQDRGRAAVAGSPAGGDGTVRSLVAVAGGDDALRLTTGRLERADGRPIGGPAPAPFGLRIRLGGKEIQPGEPGVRPDLVLPKLARRDDLAPALLQPAAGLPESDVALDLAVEHVRARLNAARD